MLIYNEIIFSAPGHFNLMTALSNVYVRRPPNTDRCTSLPVENDSSLRENRKQMQPYYYFLPPPQLTFCQLRHILFSWTLPYSCIFCISKQLHAYFLTSWCYIKAIPAYICLWTPHIWIVRGPLPHIFIFVPILLTQDPKWNSPWTVFVLLEVWIT